MSDLDGDEPNFFEYLRAVPNVQALAGDRIYAGRIPQHVYDSRDRVMDCAVYTRVGGQRGITFCGSEGLVAGQYQLDIYSPDDVRFVQLARAIRRALVDYSGPMGAVEVKKVFIETDFDSQEAEPGLNRRTQTYTVWYAESEG
jgi:hypothetical protein